MTAAPPAVGSLTVQSARHTILENAVVVTVDWSPPSDSNGAFYYNLTYTADQAPDYPQERRRFVSDSSTLVGFRDNYIIEDGLPYAVYSVIITAVNIKHGRPGLSTAVIHRSLSIGNGP